MANSNAAATTPVTATVIFDNGGGVTVQLSNGTHSWAHSYDDAEQAAGDVRDALTDGSFYGFDGDESDAATVDPTDEEIRNGGFRVVIFSDLDDLHTHANEQFQSGWGNERRFARDTLKRIL